MTTTPEQMQEWRVKFESFYSDDRECMLTRDANSGDYVNETIDSGWWGYLRRCKETEQAIKDARKQALEDAIAICDARINQYNAPVSEGLLSKWQVLMVKTEGVGASDCKDAIKELLK